MLDLVSFPPISFVYTLLKDGAGAICRRKRHLTESEIVAMRQKWKAEIEEQLWERRQKKLGMDVIIRDVRRIDQYPDTNAEKRGISAWYKCGLMDTYHRGVMLGLRWESLKLVKGDKWRYTNDKVNENGDAKVILIGYVRYENIEGIDWKGDEYYGQPHFYCHFDARRGELYEKLAFCEKKELNEIPFYTE